MKKILIIAVLLCTAWSCSPDSSTKGAKKKKEKGQHVNTRFSSDSIFTKSFTIQGLTEEELLSREFWGPDAHIFYFDSTGRVQNK